MTALPSRRGKPCVFVSCSSLRSVVVAYEVSCFVKARWQTRFVVAVLAVSVATLVNALSNRRKAFFFYGQDTS